ncbi:helix-turn-helix transcriptional regulator [Pseudoglutamicibacter cumminsii]|uniref:helix-turn-helix transcriptional regulator n=1 Tax=Pseudoglutamicibacter cumminsii TaxID=156979 RepID=UPI00195652C2|nr:helix-turn-helix transcriptional regulator [Pseudoglutamicibacter cumminsii]MBM7796855.1 transcriptional regulator with XRE-family HTH domain [Pseudoglutamicibacter cumminsii]MCT1685492.1 helix-turn-helix domain-containing protein [Pseudoglutamicibacter cumminsii]
MTTTYQDTARGFTARPQKQQIRLAMKFNRWTNAELARRAGISPGTVGNVLGARATCNPETAAKIADALNVDTTDLFTLEPITYAA